MLGLLYDVAGSADKMCGSSRARLRIRGIVRIAGIVAAFRRRRILTGELRTRFPGGEMTGRGLKPINSEAFEERQSDPRERRLSSRRWRLNGDAVSAIPTFRSHLRNASYLDFIHRSTPREVVLLSTLTNLRHSAISRHFLVLPVNFSKMSAMIVQPHLIVPKEILKIVSFENKSELQSSMLRHFLTYFDLPILLILQSFKNIRIYC